MQFNLYNKEDKYHNIKIPIKQKNTIMIEQLIYLLLTVVIPIKMTYSAIRNEQSENKKLWAVYWAFYFGFKSLQWECWMLQYAPVDFVFVLFALWLYNDSYKVKTVIYLGRTLLS